MTTLVVGDVHGCSVELAELLDEVRPDRTVLVGDLFTKGPDPVGIWEIIEQRGIEAVLGNHDVRLLQIAVGKRKNDHRGRAVVELLEKRAPGWHPWLDALPLFLEVDGWTVVHAGIDPSGDLEQTKRRQALYMRRYPDEGPKNPFWHAVYEGERRVIFGHDARRGLIRVERDGKPLLIGLDTGCVYGGRLSGYIIERDEIVAVRARRSYCPV